jgi:hypothetical protein
MFCKLLWRIVRLSYPWFSLVITLWRMATGTDVHRSRARVKFWRLYSRINFAALLSIAIDLSQPEYWV